MKIPQADWSHWSQMRTARLWECVALSLNIEPRDTELDRLKYKADYNSSTIDRVLEPARKEFRSRLDIVLSHYLHDRLLLPEIAHQNQPYSVLLLPNFAAWARSMEWKLPTELETLAQSPSEPSRARQGPRWPWGEHETELLRKLAGAAERFWTNYDPTDPSTAPTNQQVIDWLKDQKVAERSAEVIATILRADGLPTGPRK